MVKRLSGFGRGPQRSLENAVSNDKAKMIHNRSIVVEIEN